MKGKVSPKRSLLPRVDLGRRNLLIFLIGLMVIAVGYVLLAQGPWDNPLSRSVAPIVLLIAYFIIFPIGIFYKRKKPEADEKRRREGKE